MAGEVVHMEFPTGDNDRAQRFWSGVFGWEFGGSVTGDEYDYRMARTSDICGAALMPSEERGHPNFYLDTPNIDASIARVRELGGEAADKSPVPTHGWFSVCKDSEGNAFHLWQSDPDAA